MTDYEKGSAAWDIGMILTRHGNGTIKTAHHDFAVCARVLDLRGTAARRMSGPERLAHALAVTCSCGAGDSRLEQTSIRRQHANRSRTAATSSR